MGEQWSEWIDHDGGGCPLPVGTICERKFGQMAWMWLEPGMPVARYHLGPIHPMEMGSWNGERGAAQVVRYRYKRPRALVDLIQAARAVGGPREREAA